MPRKPRFFIPDMAVHVVQRGHSRHPVFFDTGDHQVYMDYLHDALSRHGCKLHAYVLMTNHVHRVPRSGRLQEGNATCCM